MRKKKSFDAWSGPKLPSDSSSTSSQANASPEKRAAEAALAFKQAGFAHEFGFHLFVHYRLCWRGFVLVRRQVRARRHGGQFAQVFGAYDALARRAQELFDAGRLIGANISSSS